MKSATPFVIANILLFVAVVAMNYLANALPIAGVTPAQVSDMFPTLFTPAGFTFSIWGIIYLLLLGFAIYQASFFNKEAPIFLQRIGWLFGWSCAANIGWLLAFHHLQIGLSMLIMLLLLGSLLTIYLRLDIGKTTAATAGEKWLVRLPFSVYLGWITVATIANASILLSQLGWNGVPGGAQIWAVVVISAAIGIALWALFSRRDIAFAAVIIWALFGIYSKRVADTSAEDGMVEISAMAGMVMVGLGIVYRVIKRN
jgi:hypothetical protein